MERLRHKQKKDKPTKYVDKEKTPSFITDVKSIKENLKIKEILRTVKMNNSMRMKAPRGSKVMNSKDFNDNECLFDEEPDSTKGQQSIDPLSATNPVMVSNTDIDKNAKDSEHFIINSNDTNSELKNDDSDEMKQEIENINMTNNDSSTEEVESLKDMQVIDSIPEETPDVKIQKDPEDRKIGLVKSRERKLSLDQTMLTRRVSQSELDLHSIGKSPLERKSSFFRKKMDSFLKNTTEIFKRQSLGSKTEPMHRKGSMSVSLQSLNENTGDLWKNNQEGSVSSLHSSSTVGRSNSSLTTSQGPAMASDQESFAGSQPVLSASQPLGESSSSINSLNEAYIQDALLNSRAISMSSGLDSATGKRRTKSNRSNRVTWAASESVANTLRRSIQDERFRETQMYAQSYQDISSIPENDDLCGPKVDSKGRRLSYQRAVSGEDPMPSRHHDSTFKRKHFIPENSKANYELSNQLAEYARNGIPSLKGFVVADIVDEAFAYLLWADRRANMEEYFDFRTLPPSEEARQTVIKELISTEVDYIKSLLSIVEVFMAAAHALQDKGKLLDVDTERLFLNIPDVLNASLYFWEMSMYPMIANAVETTVPFNTELMAPGFCRFREFFTPYEKYVSEQTKALDYLRSLSNNAEFMTYLTWCHTNKSCNRLQLSDMMVKPMQRLTKYSLILRRIIHHTDTEPERTSLIAMESFAKNYVLDLNRAIRQREELEKLDALANSIDCYEIDFKDDDLDMYFRKTSHINLKAPMQGCLPNHSRSIVHQGDVRFKDHMKELEVRAFLLTDMLLVCKKLSKGSVYPFKIIRPKYMIDKMIVYPRYAKGSKDVIKDLIFVVLDDVGSSNYGFTLSETSKDSNSQGTLKLWEQKIREAKLSYEFGLWFAKNPSRDLSVEMDSSSDYAISSNSAKHGVKHSSDDMNIEREARERVAAMLHRNMGASTEYDFSQASMNTDSFDAAGDTSGITGAGGGARHNLRHPMQRNSTGGSSRNSRLSSLQQSTSAASHDEPQPGPSRYNYRAGSSVEHFIPPQNPDDTVTSITVNVVSESESETVVPSPSMGGPLPSARSLGGSHNTLRVQPQSGVLALVHSLPDLTIDPSPPPRPASGPSHLSASELLYQSHHEVLQRNRLHAQHQYLTPDHRGTSYPPPSPTRASLKRGLAFSYSFKNPPLTKMGHVNSQSQMQADAGPSTSQQKKDNEKGAAVSVVVVPEPSTSSEKNDKKSKPVNSRNKSGGSSARSLSPVQRDDKGD